MLDFPDGTVAAPDRRVAVAKYLFDKIVIGAIVFCASHTANVWFEKQKAMNSYRLKDSDLITEHVSAHWKGIDKLAMAYDELQSARQWAWVTRGLADPPGKRVDLDESARELDRQKAALVKAIAEDTHVIGRPMSRHLFAYLQFMDGYYMGKRGLIGEKDAAVVKHNQEMVDGLGDLMSRMRVDLSSTRDYALRQVDR